MNYTSYAEMTLEPKMAHNIKNVEKLLDGLTHKITAIGRKERQKVIDFKRTFPGQAESEFNTWDQTFYGSRYKDKTAGFTEVELA